MIKLIQQECSQKTGVRSQNAPAQLCVDSRMPLFSHKPRTGIVTNNY